MAHDRSRRGNGPELICVGFDPIWEIGQLTSRNVRFIHFEEKKLYIYYKIKILFLKKCKLKFV